MLDDPVPALAQAEAAAAAGDESWERWVVEHRRGEALVVRLELQLDFHAEERDVLRIANPGVFIEKHPDPPKVEQQIAEIVGKDFYYLEREFNARGHQVDQAELSEMYVHVELEEDVQKALTEVEGPTRQPYDRPPEVEVRLARPDDAGK